MITKAGAKLGLTTTTFAVPAFLALHPESRELLSRDMSAMITGGVVGSLSLAA